MFINDLVTDIHFKVVYFGAGRVGKSACLHYVYNKTRLGLKSRMFQVRTNGQRCLFFSFIAKSIPPVAGRLLRFHLYTVPGGLWSEDDWRTVLRDADAVMFVASSLEVREESNLECHRRLERLLAEGVAVSPDIPRVYCYTDRAPPEILPIAELEARLNPGGKYPSFEVDPREGTGVIASLRELSKPLVARAQAIHGAG